MTLYEHLLCWNDEFIKSSVLFLQLDTLNEKALHLSSKVATSPTTELNNLTHLCNDVCTNTSIDILGEYACLLAILLF